MLYPTKSAFFCKLSQDAEPVAEGLGNSRRTKGWTGSASIGYCIIHNTYIHRYIYAYIHTMSYIHTYMHTYIHAYIHTYIHTYIHIHTHTYIHTHIRMY